MNNKNQKRKSAIKQLNPIIKTSNVMMQNQQYSALRDCQFCIMTLLVMFRLRLMGGTVLFSRRLFLKKYNKIKADKRLIRGQNRFRVTYTPIYRSFLFRLVDIMLIYRQLTFQTFAKNVFQQIWNITIRTNLKTDKYLIQKNKMIKWK